MTAEQTAQAAEKRNELIEKLADVDEQLGELFLMEEPIDEDMLRGAIRRATTSLAFVPIFMGSAYKNKGVQLLLDGVTDYLPSPAEVANTALVCNPTQAVKNPSGAPLCVRLQTSGNHIHWCDKPEQPFHPGALPCSHQCTRLSLELGCLKWGKLMTYCCMQ